MSTMRSIDHKLFLGLIGGFCLIPIVIAVTLFLIDYRFTTWGHSHYGHLANPPVALDSLSMHDVQGNSWSATILNHRWALVLALAADVPCDVACQKQLWQVQQIQIALGQYQDRLLKFVVLVGPLSEMLISQLHASKVEDRAIVQSSFGIFWQPGQLYLVDPSGQVVMIYPSQAEGVKILKDIRHLIKLSTHSR